MVKNLFTSFFFSEIKFLQLLDNQTGETSPEMIYILLQTAAADLEGSTEVK